MRGRRRARPGAGNDRESLCRRCGPAFLPTRRSPALCRTMSRPTSRPTNIRAPSSSAPNCRRRRAEKFNARFCAWRRKPRQTPRRAAHDFSGTPDSRAACVARDADDPLRSLRDRFILPDGLLYLDGNSLGPMPRAAAAVFSRTIEEEWARDLIKSWNSAGWFDLPSRLGDRLGALIGAAPGQTRRLRYDLDQSLQGDPCRDRAAAGPRRHRRRGGRLSDRSLYRRRARWPRRAGRCAGG